MSSLLGILVALCGAEFIHNNFEVWGIRKKVSWLNALQDGQEYGRWPLNINTRLKMIALHASLLVIFVALFYFILKGLNLSDRSLVFIGIVTLLANYICTTWCVDIYHHQVSKLITKAKKPS